LILLAFVLIRQGVTPGSEVAQTPAPATATQGGPGDPDDVLLQDIQSSLEREVPAPLAPAAVLVEEVASASKQGRQLKEN
ncbi:MAG: hypothetical protein WA188_17375, partial [Terriglobales bacterium]